jgi:hypothetical protein
MLSTNLPTGPTALPSAALLSSNVRKEADAAFMRELQRTDPRRHSALVKNLQKAAVISLKSAEPRCAHCGLILPAENRSDSRYCDQACKKGAYRARRAA